MDITTARGSVSPTGVVPMTATTALIVLVLLLIGPNIKTAIAILNCLLARQLCFEDASCSAILEIIPRVCGPELVACSTVTVTKCQAALRTLQAFPFFKPTCLCREPHVDPVCNSFRDFLFDHPCVFVLKKEKDPYPVDALPTCNHALSVCQQEKSCIKLYEDYKALCKVRDNQCRMEDRELCHEAWTNLRLSPMFGCICPNNHIKKRCDRIFSIVNHNPCVDALPVSFDLSGTDSALYPYDPEMGYFKHFWFPPTNLYPYFLFPPTGRPRMPLAFASHSPASHVPRTGTGTRTRIAIDLPPEPSTEPESPPLLVQVVSTSENDSSGYYIESQVENPLVESPGPHGKGHDSLGQSPANQLSGYGAHDGLRKLNGSHFDEEANHVYASSTHDHKVSNQSLPETNSAADLNHELSRITLQSTCHLALEGCNRNNTCRSVLHPVLLHCDSSRCSRNACMEALQALYRTPDLNWSLEIAFCLCKKTDNKQDGCMMAQEKLHPVCAQRQELAGAMVQHPVPTCHSLAEYCREDKECRSRLEYYEQSCAVDSVTKKCAGPAAECRAAMLGILGTELRSTCACKGTDLSQLYDCLGWQRLLWVNPCVVESQKDFHVKRLADHTIPTTTVVTKTFSRAFGTTLAPIQRQAIHITPTEESISEQVEQRSPEVKLNIGSIGGFGGLGSLESSEAFETTPDFVTATMESTTPSTTTSTIPPRYCVVQKPYQSDQYIREGKTKRLYREDEPECSELCHCGLGESLSCHTLCVERVPCRTDFAFYSHAAPAYQAYRGRCVCYSGRFICMRPLPGEYSLPRGVFLFLGYSATDEALLRPHTNLSVLDAVRSLQEFVRQHVNNETSCTLSLFNVTNENVILVGRVPEIPTSSAAEILNREKEQCSELLQDISEKVNSQHHEFSSHLLLSIFKMAEVEIASPEVNSASCGLEVSSTFVLFLAVLSSLVNLDRKVMS